MPVVPAYIHIRPGLSMLAHVVLLAPMAESRKREMCRHKRWRLGCGGNQHRAGYHHPVDAFASGFEVENPQPAEAASSEHVWCWFVVSLAGKLAIAIC